MRILLLGEYSNVHWTLACALREAGHEVCVVSNGDDWKGYRQDVALVRKSTGIMDTLRYLFQLARLLPRWTGYDVVQLINPVHFIDLKAERGVKIYDYLRRHNKRIFLAAVGDDYYYIHNSFECRTLRYCDFYTQEQEIVHAWNQANIRDWLHSPKKEVSIHVAQTCDGIIAGLYEYWVAYQPYFPDKTTFIPLPIRCPHATPLPVRDGKVRFFIGIQRLRSALKGTDVMYQALLRVKEKYPDRCEILKAESVPFDEYQRMMATCDVLLDQLYSYTPAMNALHAMSRGIVAVTGGEPESYEILHENQLHPIINTQPTEQDVFEHLEQLVLHQDNIPSLKKESIAYVQRHHDYRLVAQQYLQFWERNGAERTEESSTE